ncbi:MAG TPA: DNA polymerase III subunit gamma/tau, partial [Colwellia sp.]|nr:DNA polymerase III subunit gamma/tau [Colwellia sp.]
IDPTTIRKANQVDKWAHMIDSMELTARLRQLAIHATIDEASTEEHLILCLNQATKHLITESAQQQLQQHISQFLSREISVTINTVEETVADPYQIQSHINDKRYDYAKDLLEKDDIVQALQQDFQASLDENSIS